MTCYDDNYQPKTANFGGAVFELMEEPHHILQNRREELGLSKQQVADKAHILFKQYARLESGERSFYGASFRICMSVCYALKLDPRRFFPEAMVNLW